MKKYNNIFLAGILLISYSVLFVAISMVNIDNASAVDYPIPEDYTTFVDPNLYNCVVSEYKNSYPDIEISSGLSYEQLQQITDLTCDNKNISNTTGIEEMTSLTYLDLRDNQFTDIDLSHNTSITTLNLSGNQLNYLDLSNLNLLVLNVDRNTLLKTNITIQRGDSDYIYNLNSLKFIRNGFGPLGMQTFTVQDEPYMSYNDISMLLTVNDLAATNGYAYAVGEIDNMQGVVARYYYKLKLPNFNYIFFDANGGENAINSLNCYMNLNDSETSCGVTIQSIKPSRDNYNFLGWADTKDAVDINDDYTVNDVINLTTDKTIYAVWKEVEPEHEIDTDDENNHGGNEEKSEKVPNTGGNMKEDVFSKSSPILFSGATMFIVGVLIRILITKKCRKKALKSLI